MLDTNSSCRRKHPRPTHVRLASRRRMGLARRPTSRDVCAGPGCSRVRGLGLVLSGRSIMPIYPTSRRADATWCKRDCPIALALLQVAMLAPWAA